MQIFFILISIFGCIYFLFKKTGVDYYAVAFFSAVIYFMPGFFGYTSYHVDGVWVETEIIGETYLVYSIVLSSIFLFSCFSRSLSVVGCFSCARGVSELTVLWVLTVFSILSMVIMTFTSGAALFSPDKNIVLENQNRSFLIFESALCLGGVLAYYVKRKILFAFYLLCFAFYFYIGFRSAVAVAFISIFVLMLSTHRKRLISELSFQRIALVFSVGFFIFLYKGIGYSVKSGAWDRVFDALRDIDFYLGIISHSEPFVIQEVLNNILRLDYRISADSLLSVLYQFMFFASDLGADVVGFNDQFQSVLYPDVDYGMAANIWAQMMAVGSWPLFILFLMLFNIAIYLFNSTLRSDFFILKVCCAPIFVYFVFYIHRNDLAYQVNLEKRLITVLAFSVVIGWVLSQIKNSSHLVHRG